jgi:protein arginine N-methyltransferase 1
MWAAMGSDLLQFHAFCLTDTGTRIDQYARAIAGAVRPGDVVVDVGAGMGILSYLACAAGAQRVYAIEESEVSIYGEMLAAAGGFRDRVRFIQARSTQVTLPERVDVIVADVHDTFGLQPGGAAALLDARDRFLKPGGTLIPARIDLLVAPVEAPDLYRRRVDVWQHQVHDVDLSVLRTLAINQRHPARFEPMELVGSPTRIASIELTTTTGLDAAGEIHLAAPRDATLHGLCGCFATTLANDIVVQNVPGDSRTTNFAQAFLPIESPHVVAEGERIRIRVWIFDGSEARWQMRIAHHNQLRRVQFDQATFLASPMRAEDLKKQTSDYRPRLTAHGAMQRELLEQFDGTLTSADLEKWLLDRFGTQLPSPREVAAFLKATIARSG